MPPFHLPRPAAFALLVSIVIVFLSASIAPSPLYATYQAEWGFSPITVTVVFGVYAIAVLATLLVVGSLSDHVGRRPVLLVAIAVQAIAMIVVITAGGVGELLVARVLQGIATGGAVGAVGAGLIDLDRARGIIANAVTPMAGTATGALIAGAMVQYLPDPTHLVYLVLLAILVVQFAGVLVMDETTARAPGALASLRPRLAVSDAVRAPLLVAVPILVAIWALVGFFGSLGPALARLVVGSASPLAGGLAIFAVAGTAAVTVLVLRALPARTVIVTGAVALLAGVAIVLGALALRSVPAFFAGAMVAGVGFGAGFQGAIGSVVPLAAPSERAGVLSVLFSVSYISMGLPSVLGGVLAVHGGVLAASREYGGAVMALAAVTLLGLALAPRAARRARPVPAA